MFLNVKNTQENYDNMGDASDKNAPECIVVAIIEGECNMDIFNIKDNPRLRCLNKLLPCSI